MKYEEATKFLEGLGFKYDPSWRAFRIQGATLHRDTVSDLCMDKVEEPKSAPVDEIKLSAVRMKLELSTFDNMAKQVTFARGWLGHEEIDRIIALQRDVEKGDRALYAKIGLEERAV